MFKIKAPRFVMPLFAGLALSAGVAMGQDKIDAENDSVNVKPYALLTRDTARHSYYSSMMYVQGVQHESVYEKAKSRLVYVQGQALETKDSQAFFGLGDGKTPMDGDTLKSTFAQFGKVDTHSYNVVLDFSTALLTKTAEDKTYISGLALRNRTDVKNKISSTQLTTQSIFGAINPSLNQYANKDGDQIDIVFTGPSGLAAFPELIHAPAGKTRMIVSSDAKTRAVENPSIELMSIMNPAIRGGRADSFRFAEAGAFAASPKNNIFVVFTSDNLGQSDTVRVGNHVIYGDTAKTTPTLYVANIDSVVQHMIEENNVPGSSGLLGVEALRTADAYARRIRRGKTTFEALDDKQKKVFRAAAVEFLSEPLGSKRNPTYRYEKLGMKGSEAFRTYLMDPKP